MTASDMVQVGCHGAAPLPPLRCPQPFTHLQAVCDALNRRRNRKGHRLRYSPDCYVDGLLVPRNGVSHLLNPLHVNKGA